jgi:hypothetical protein
MKKGWLQSYQPLLNLQPWSLIVLTETEDKLRLQKYLQNQNGEKVMMIFLFVLINNSPKGVKWI